MLVFAISLVVGIYITVLDSIFRVAIDLIAV